MSRASAYQLSAAARLDLLQIWIYLTEHATVEIADRVSADIESAIHRLVLHRGLGHVRTDLTKRPLKFYRIHSYLIVYDGKSRPLRIARILHASRDTQEILRED